MFMLHITRREITAIILLIFREKPPTLLDDLLNWSKTEHGGDAKGRLVARSKVI